MENKTTETKFVPDKELLDFANYFSENYKTLEVGEYFSDNKKYQISYLDKIIQEQTGSQSKTGIRISKITGIIDVDKSLLNEKEYTSDFIFYFIMWCIIIIGTNNERGQRGNVIISDEMATEYYLTTGRSRKNLIVGLAKLFMGEPSEMNKKRLKFTNKQIKSWMKN